MSAAEDQIIHLCETLHGSSRMPLYLYQHGSVLRRWPEENPLFDPPTAALVALCAQQKDILHVNTSVFSVYGLVRVHEEDFFVVMGPVGHVPYSAADIRRLRSEQRIPDELAAAFEMFLKKIPVMHEDAFVYHLLLAHYALNGELKSIDQYFDRDVGRERNDVYRRFAAIEAELCENEQIDLSFEITEKVFPLIENGDLSNLMEYMKHPPDLRIGIYSSSALRQCKTMLIITVSQISRIAIKAGMPVQTSLRLMNTYIRTADELDSVSDVNTLMMRAIYDYTKRISDIKRPRNLPGKLNKCIQYIHENVNKPLHIEEIAKHVGLSRAYLSNQFSCETGMNLSSYVLNVKLDASRELLRTTAWSIGEISSYLGFSSQSHFQRSFKAYTGLSPRKFREQG